METNGSRFILTKIMNVLQKIKKRNYFLLIRVQARELRIPIIIPMPLGVVEDLLESVTHLYRISRIFIPKSSLYKWKWSYGSKRSQVTFQWKYLDSDRYLDLTHELIQEIRRQGRLTLVEIKDHDAHVSIKLY